MDESDTAEDSDSWAFWMKMLTMAEKRHFAHSRRGLEFLFESFVSIVEEFLVDRNSMPPLPQRVNHPTALSFRQFGLECSRPTKRMIFLRRMGYWPIYGSLMRLFVESVCFIGGTDPYEDPDLIPTGKPIYFSFDRFFKSMVRLLEIEQTEPFLEIGRNTWSLGSYIFVEGNKKLVILSLEADGDKLLKLINDGLPPETEIPGFLFLVLDDFSESWEARMIEGLERRNSCFIALSDIVKIDLKHSLLRSIAPLQDYLESKRTIGEQGTAPGTGEREHSGEWPDEDPVLNTKLEFSIKNFKRTENGENYEKLCIRSNHPRNGKSGMAEFECGPKKLSGNLMRLLTATEGGKDVARKEFSFWELLLELYGFDAKAECAEECKRDKSNNLDESTVFSRAVQPELKRLQSLIVHVRTQMEKAGIDPGVLPKISTAWDARSTKVRLHVAQISNLDREKEERSHNVLSLDRLYNSIPGKSRPDDEGEDSLDSNDDKDEVGCDEARPGESAVDPKINEDEEL